MGRGAQVSSPRSVVEPDASTTLWAAKLEPSALILPTTLPSRSVTVPSAAIVPSGRPLGPRTVPSGSTFHAMSFARAEELIAWNERGSKRSTAWSAWVPLP